MYSEPDFAVQESIDILAVNILAVILAIFYWPSVRHAIFPAKKYRIFSFSFHSCCFRFLAPIVKTNHWLPSTQLKGSHADL